MNDLTDTYLRMNNLLLESDYYGRRNGRRVSPRPAGFGVLYHPISYPPIEAACHH